MDATFRLETVARFWSKVNKDGPVHPQLGTACWEWSGALKPNGYGHVYVNGAKIMTHRLAWLIGVGPIPEGLFVCHHCDNRKCARADHLFIGTHADNMRDMAEKGRTVKEKPTCHKGHDMSVHGRTAPSGHRWCEVCMEKRSRAYYLSHLDKKRAYREANKEKMRAYLKEWRAKRRAAS